MRPELMERVRERGRAGHDPSAQWSRAPCSSLLARPVLPGQPCVGNLPSTGPLCPLKCAAHPTRRIINTCALRAPPRDATASSEARGFLLKQAGLN